MRPIIFYGTETNPCLVGILPVCTPVGHEVCLYTNIKTLSKRRTSKRVFSWILFDVIKCFASWKCTIRQLKLFLLIAINFFIYSLGVLTQITHWMIIIWKPIRHLHLYKKADRQFTKYQSHIRSYSSNTLLLKIISRKILLPKFSRSNVP